jgi:hypothetical protein
VFHGSRIMDALPTLTIDGPLTLTMDGLPTLTMNVPLTLTMKCPTCMRILNHPVKHLILFRKWSRVIVSFPIGLLETGLKLRNRAMEDTSLFRLELLRQYQVQNFVVLFCDSCSSFFLQVSECNDQNGLVFKHYIHLNDCNAPSRATFCRSKITENSRVFIDYAVPVSLWSIRKLRRKFQAHCPI